LLSRVFALLFEPLEEPWHVNKVFGWLLMNLNFDLPDGFAIGFPTHGTEKVQSFKRGFVQTFCPNDNAVLCAVIVPQLYNAP